MTPTQANDNTDPMGQLLATRIANLDQGILHANQPGNLGGLLAHHILGSARVSFTWNVSPMTSAWLDENEHRLPQGPVLATLGFGLVGFPSAESDAARRHLADGLPTLMRRDPFPADGITFLNDPGQVVGLALAVNAVHEEIPKARAWLTDVLHDSRLRPPSTFLGTFHQYARHLIGAPGRFRPDVHDLDDPTDLAAVHWLISVGAADNLKEAGADDIRFLRSRLLNGLALGHADTNSAPRSALLLKAATHIVTRSVDDLILSRSHVGILLSRFEDAMRRWRYDKDDLQHPIRWPIRSEREVQDILWLILRPVFDDLVDEETLRKLGHSTYRADFGIPSLELLIEVKYARSAADFKKYEKEILEDYTAYLTGNEAYRKLAVFIYDESASSQEYGTTRNALLKMPNITDVIIVSRPSHVPSPQDEQR
ncbi:hypothetical protein [Actinokineospora globicatena]|uniref:PD-(D/E)XK nuclease domain-containing protein n=1 Tax=Actinokineospora globicatena TaxID=103729 RepID=UPI0020A54F1D|nr:hypothetical protein [Actinokineospora globicatena]MCP2304115.1 hypothetical protein [Actinokineospora globicatena]GLW78533.1 hypothetical protein Aglo01_30150 [Actinokineospora globicatena]GLW84803.1 hypothetical protein Aglo02_24430 [Actinokineospora globicatena]